MVYDCGNRSSFKQQFGRIVSFFYYINKFALFYKKKLNMILAKIDFHDTNIKAPIFKVKSNLVKFV